MRFGCLPHGYSQAHVFLGENVAFGHDTLNKSLHITNLNFINDPH